MAIIALTVQDARRSSNGVNVTDTAVSASSGNTYQFNNNGQAVLYIKNASGSTCTVTVTTPGTIDGLAITDLTASVVTAKEHLIGPFPARVYNDASALVNFTVNQTVTAMVLRL